MTREEIEDTQEIQNALDNIEANDVADSTPLIITDIPIPNSITPTDFTETWQNTGDLIVTGSDSTNLPFGAVYRATADVSVTPTQGVVLDGVTITPVEEEQPEPVPDVVEEQPRRRRGTTTARPVETLPNMPRPEGQVYGPMTYDEAVQGQKEDLRKKRIEKEIKKMEAFVKRQKQDNRRRLHQNQSYVMGVNDLMILSDYRNRFYFQKTDTLKTGNLINLNNTNVIPCPKTGFQPNVVTNGLMYDKNMNPLTINYSRNKIKSNKTFNRIDIENTTLGKKYEMIDHNRWLIVNKTAFMSSNGKDFRIKHRVGYTLQETLAVKKGLIKRMTEGEEFVKYLKSLVGQIYDEENYEIIYEYGFMPGQNHNNFHIYFQFPNLTISNSIEVSHQIENLITMWRGKHHFNNNSSIFQISYGMKGLRTTFSAKDAFYNYSHSHLSSGSFGYWDEFCMGDRHFMSNINTFNQHTNELEFETMLIAMLDHVSWESLEGGPYMKMEDIGQDGGGIIIPRRTRTLTIYSKGVMAELMQIIRVNVDFNHLYDAFTLHPMNNKETIYTIDEKKFIQLFNKEFDEETILNFYEEWEINPVIYIPSENVFKRSNFDSQATTNWKNLLKTAQKKVLNVPITYINGKYIRPLIVQEPELNQKVSKKIIQSLHPDIIFYIANIIYYHLLNELKNVKK